MQILPITKENRIKLLDTAVECMHNDPSYKMALRGIAAGPKYLREVLRLQLKYGVKTGNGWCLEDYRGFLLGHFQTQEKWWPNFQMSMESQQTILDVFDKYERKDFSKNLDKMRMKKAVAWRKEAGPENYYYIDLICVAPEHRGSGAFRRLLEPALALADQEKVPVLLDTYNADAVPIFKHFGFEPFSLIKSPTVRLYCLKREAGLALPYSAMAQLPAATE